MHYTSVPNILKVLNPLFLGRTSRKKLDEAGTQRPEAAEPAQPYRAHTRVRPRLRLRQFPGHRLQGNAADRGRDQRAGDVRTGRRSDIPLTNFRGIELRDFPAEVARLALIIAEYQCDVVHRGQREALAEFLPLGRHELDHLRQRPEARLA